MESVFTLTQAGNFTVEHILFNLTLTLILTAGIAYVYRITHRGFSYSQNFSFTLIMMSIITTVIMMVIGNNIAVAFGLLGAFAIIRFRTVVKETKDTGFIFFALAEGMAIGTDSHLIAIVSTLFLLTVIYALSRFNFGSIRYNDYLLTFNIETDKNPSDYISDILGKYLRSSMLLNMSTKEGSRTTETVYSVRFKEEKNSNLLINELSEVDGVVNVHIISSKSDIEY